MYQDRAKGAKVGVDSRLMTYSQASKLRTELALRDSTLFYPWQNFIDLLWRDRPPRPQNEIHIQPLELSGEPARSKIESIRKWIISRAPPDSSKRKPEDIPIGAFFANLYDIAWVLNLRGTDFTFSPVFLAYLFVSVQTVVLFTERAKISGQVEGYLNELGITTKRYSDAWAFLRESEWGTGKVNCSRLSCSLYSTMTLDLDSRRHTLHCSAQFRRDALYHC